MSPLGNAIAVRLLLRSRQSDAIDLTEQLQKIEGVGVVFEQLREVP